MKSSDIRQRFIDFFKDESHTFVPASPVVPQDDPTILFTNAGMNQFKDIFLGVNPKGLKSAVNSQPCIRVSGKHNDLDDVGRDGTHQTLFEMLGNWSFGDYSKEGAIRFAWRLLTEGFSIPKDKLYVSVYESDDESEALWKTVTDVRHDHILRFGKKDNFWEMGDVGPCGPCSEIHVDLGEGDGTAISTDPILGVNGENERFIEFWNLVFIQYDRQPDGTLVDLAEQHVDTGMGLERLAAYMQGVSSNYDTDLFVPIIAKIAEISSVAYSPGDKGMAHRVLADHVRTLVFSIADNVMPSNDGRGYVLRRILRRALRYAHQLGVHEPVMHRLVPVVVDLMGGFYPHVAERQDFIAQVILAEEESFLRTLKSGMERFDALVEAEQSRENKQISGEAAFKLYDTYGFPLDLTQLLAEEVDMTVDLDAFSKCLEAQQDRSRKGAKTVVYEVEEVSDVDLDALAQRMPDLHHAPNQSVARGGEARLLVSHDDKLAMARHHTATHLLHEALRQVLGDHVNQAGSLVDTDRLRFDFTHFKALSQDELAKVKQIVLDEIAKDTGLATQVTTLEKAKAAGAMALFGEKYDADAVRLVEIGEFSKELCGGTHVLRTGLIESFVIVSEAAISSGTRRIEALAGRDVIAAYEAGVREKFAQKLQGRLDKLATLVETLQSAGETVSVDVDVLGDLSIPVAELANREGEIVSAIKGLEKAVSRLNASSIDDLLAGLTLHETGVGAVYSGAFSSTDSVDVAVLRDMVDRLIAEQGAVAAILLTQKGDKALGVIKVAKLLPSPSARDLMTVFSGVAGGNGGGRPDMVQLGGADFVKCAAGVDAVIAAFEA